MAQFLNIVSKPLLDGLDTLSVMQAIVASSKLRTIVSSSLSLVVVIFPCLDEDVIEASADMRFLLTTAAKVTGSAPYPPVSNAGGWAFPWYPGQHLLTCFDWHVASWRLACSSVEKLLQVEAPLRQQLGFGDDIDLLPWISTLGMPWHPLSAPPPLTAVLPQIRQAWVTPAVAAGWPQDGPLSGMWIQGALEESMQILASGITRLRLTGTTPEDLHAVDHISGHVKELEIAPTNFESFPSDDWAAGYSEEEFLAPRIHIAPDPRRFSSLQRLQARLGADSLVIFRAFVQALPLLRRLGTIETYLDEIQSCASWLPTGLEECVMAVQDENISNEDQLSQLSNMNAIYMHFSFYPSITYVAALSKLMMWPGGPSFSFEEAPAESTPLDCAVPGVHRRFLQHGELSTEQEGNRFTAVTNCGQALPPNL